MGKWFDQQISHYKFQIVEDICFDFRCHNRLQLLQIMSDITFIRITQSLCYFIWNDTKFVFLCLEWHKVCVTLLLELHKVCAALFGMIQGLPYFIWNNTKFVLLYLCYLEWHKVCVTLFGMTQSLWTLWIKTDDLSERCIRTLFPWLPEHIQSWFVDPENRHVSSWQSQRPGESHVYNNW